MISAVEVGFPTQRNTTREVQVEQTGGRLRYFLIQGSTQRRDRHQHHLKMASSTLDKNNNGGRLAPHHGPFRGRTCVSRPTKDTRNDNAATFSKHYYNYFIALSSPLMRQNQAIQSRALASAITHSSIHYLTTNAV